jgi:hypothetical protein
MHNAIRSAAGLLLRVAFASNASADSWAKQVG